MSSHETGTRSMIRDLLFGAGIVSLIAIPIGVLFTLTATGLLGAIAYCWGCVVTGLILMGLSHVCALLEDRRVSAAATVVDKPLERQKMPDLRGRPKVDKPDYYRGIDKEHDG